MKKYCQIFLVNYVIQCNESISVNCGTGNISSYDYDEELISFCNQTNIELKNKIDLCMDGKPEDADEEAVCVCVSNVQDDLTLFKETKYSVNTSEGVQERTCNTALDQSARKIKPMYNKCVSSLRGKIVSIMIDQHRDV